MGACSTCESSGGAAPGQWARLALAGLVAAQSMVFGLAIDLTPPDGTARTVLHTALAGTAVVVFALCGGPLVTRSWQALRQGRIIFDQLFLAGILAAFGASIHCSLTGTGHVYYELVAVLLAIWTFGGILTESQRRKALDAAGNLGREFAECDIESAEGIRTVPVGSVKPGDIVLTGPGGAVSVDGRVVSGSAFVQESALTGEPFPVVRKPGDRVRAGSYVVDSPLRIAADGPSRDLDRLLQALEEARRRPSRLQLSADRLASWFLPIVLTVAALTSALWTWKSGWEAGLFNALSVILVACPCAMGIATPVALWSALGEFARKGLTARNGDLVEKLAHINHVVFDKTGTLAAEDLEIVEFATLPGEDRASIVEMTAALEAGSHHPIARAFAAEGPSRQEARNVRVVPGAGLAGVVAGHEVAVGNRSILPDPDTAADIAARAGLGDHATRGTHVLHVVVDGRPAAVALLRETLRPGIRDGLERLRDLGVTTEIMTGDSAESAGRHGLPGLLAGLSPADKAALVEERRQRGLRVLFVGDGINDSAAMAAADASIALRSGAPLARDVADGEIAGTSLEALAGIIASARGALHTLRGNLLFAACYNALGVCLAAVGWLHPVAASLLMLVSSFVVTSRALRAPSSRPALPHRVTRSSATAVTAIAAVAAAAATFAQGPVLVWASGIQGIPAAGLALLFAATGIFLMMTAFVRPPTAPALATLLMFSVGGLAMLLGWWADAGFAPLFPGTARNCGLSGLLDGWNWMQPAMVAAALPSLALEPRRGGARWGCWLAGIIGMLAGMEAASWLAAWIPDRPPALHTLATYASMIFGMATGMTLACTAARRLIR